MLENRKLLALVLILIPLLVLGFLFWIWFAAGAKTPREEVLIFQSPPKSFPSFLALGGTTASPTEEKKETFFEENPEPQEMLPVLAGPREEFVSKREIGGSVFLENPPAAPTPEIPETEKLEFLYSPPYLQFLAAMQEVMIQDGFMPPEKRYTFEKDSDVKNFLVNFANWLRKKHLISSQEWRQMIFGLIQTLPALQKVELEEHLRKSSFEERKKHFLAAAKNSSFFKLFDVFAQTSTSTLPASSPSSLGGSIASGILSSLISGFAGYAISDFLDAFNSPLDAFTDIAGPGTSALDLLDAEFGRDVLGMDINVFDGDAFTDIAGIPGTSPADFLDAEFGQEVLGQGGELFESLGSIADIFSFVSGLFLPEECWRAGGPPAVLGRNIPVPWCKAGLELVRRRGRWRLAFTDDCDGPYGEGCIVGLGCINYNSVICPGVVGTIGAIWDSQTKICGCGI